MVTFAKMFNACTTLLKLHNLSYLLEFNDKIFFV